LNPQDSWQGPFSLMDSSSRQLNNAYVPGAPYFFFRNRSFVSAQGL
jgi:hypothetical protein